MKASIRVLKLAGSDWLIPLRHGGESCVRGRPKGRMVVLVVVLVVSMVSMSSFPTSHLYPCGVASHH